MHDTFCKSLIIDFKKSCYLQYIKFSVDSLKCWTCTFGKCLTGINYYGVEKICKGYKPVCVKTESVGKFSRTCTSSGIFIDLRPLDSKCLDYNDVKTCYCTTDNCNFASYLCSSPISVNIFILALHLMYANYKHNI